MTRREKVFSKKVWEYYKNHGRQSLPWRKTKEPYRILVSEVMLQQTQVDRVIPKYKNFIKKFPTLRTLAKASFADVLKEWQGLGYNRRAKNLHECAKTVVKNSKRRLPHTYEELVTLPGVGPYTAGAVLAFAYNKPVSMIETNIRSVYLLHFFNDATDVTDKEILQIIESTLDRKNPREWYWALMDYGVYVKKEFGNPNPKSKHYIIQPKFKDSDRQIRGAVIRTLTEGSTTREGLHEALVFEKDRIDAQIEKLLKEGMLEKKHEKLYLPT